MRLRKFSVEMKYFLLSINLLLSKLLSLIFIPHCRQITMTKDKHKGKFSKKRKVEAEQTEEVV